MGLSSLQVCMDTNDWLQALGHDQENGIDSSSPSEDIITCSRPLVERRLRPPHDQALKCPRCDSTHTKFCYYNNYSLSQPRYFCKACRRYWTKGGSLRNIPVGGGCRKNKKVAVKKSNDQLLSQNYPKFSSIPQTATDLHLSFPNMETSNFTTSFNPNLMERNYNAMLENPRQVDFMESKFNPMLGNPRSHDFMGTNEMSVVSHGCTPPSFNDHCSPFGISVDRNNGALLNDTSQRFMLTFEGSDDSNAIEMKPNNKLLSLEWQDHGSSDVGRDSIGYLDCFGPWGASINDHGSSPTNPLL